MTIKKKITTILEYAEPEGEPGGDNVCGYQVGDETGYSIQGDEGDPTGLASFEIIRPDAVPTFKILFPGVHLVPIEWDDVEEPVFLDKNMLMIRMRRV